ncbi:ABC-ATPase domain-containing protein [Alteribacillus iranensis]|uniref:Predicted ATPase of the ABC class n=1 Tax=Alteribacillus iranensis TaxID=930128 RepID=A0A1I2A168_9BACI|nr:ABC-ATPase domain-containing protein [Alteribacillus iranensis]SFE37651.1 Predicted ATPase of the ABC class [Alteribacillus iranensis]
MHELLRRLSKIDRKGYKAYNDIKGTFQYNEFTLHIDHIQADPYASPSRIRIKINRELLKLDERCDKSKHRRIATTDFFARQVSKVIHKEKWDRFLHIDGPGQEIMERSAVALDNETLDIRLSIHLPARGRTILGTKAQEMFSKYVPRMIEEAVIQHNTKALDQQLKLVDDQIAIREYLYKHNFITFIADGSILPRESGISRRPLAAHKSVPFRSPSSLRVEIHVPHAGRLTGMALKKGVNIIVGGGYHGKSTLLEAIQYGVYNHCADDGREFVITDSSACKVRAEDGRSVKGVNISSFISNLPNGKHTHHFSTENASGSTSQAANIMEYLETGTSCLLIDEDTSATNFMIRDARMQALVAKEKEPITPFIDKVQSLYKEHDVSTILVVGGAGDYFDVADCVVMMEEYVPSDVTEEAKDIARTYETERVSEAGNDFGSLPKRHIDWRSFDARKGKREKASAKGKNHILYGRDTIDVSSIEQLVNSSQTSAIANIIRYISREIPDDVPLSKTLSIVEEIINEKGLDEVSPFRGKHPGDMALPRKFELAAAINRYRKLKVKNHS